MNGTETERTDGPRSLSDLAGTLGVDPVVLRNWLYLDGVRPVAHTRSGFPRPVGLFDPAAVAAAVAARTPPAGWLSAAEFAHRCGRTVHRVRDLHEQGVLAGRKANGRLWLDPAGLAAVGEKGGTLPFSDRRRGASGCKVRKLMADARRGQDAAADEYEPDADGDHLPAGPPPNRRRKLVPFGPSGLKLYAADLEFLALVRSRFGDATRRAAVAAAVADAAAEADREMGVAPQHN